MWTIIVRDTQGAEVARAELQQGPLTIGRDRAQQLVLPSSAVSRKHARIELREGQPVFHDEGSSNGSIVDGKRVAAPVELREQSIIEITPFRLLVQKAGMGPQVGEAIKRKPPAPAAPQPAPPPPPPPPEAAKIPPQPSSATGSANEWDDVAASELERQIQGIRSYREQTDSDSQTRALKLDRDWQNVVRSMQALKLKLSSNPRLMNFDISRDGQEVAVKLKEPREKLGYRYILLSRQHPLGKFASLDAVWLTEIGREDKHYRDAREAMSDLLQRVAATLA